MHTIFYITAVKKDLRALPQKAEALLDGHFAVLAENPFAGKPLHGELKGYWSYSFSHQGTEYRIVYQILKKEAKVLIIMVGSRENLYRYLERRV